MGMKRGHDFGANADSKPSKRPKVDLDLVQIWDKLADDDENVRLEAAYDLISNHFKSADLEATQKLLTRLFGGLCSTRKCARPGFFIALVGALSMNQRQSTNKLSLAQALSMLKAQTTAEAETSKQDEKDHYYGRLLGIKAIVDSGMLTGCSESDWIKVFDLTYGLMAEKPWLRAEASAVVCSHIDALSSQQGDHTELILVALKQLKKHKLIKTTDGLGIWLTAQKYVKSSKLPQDSWKLGNPLHASEIKNLKRTLLDKPSQREDMGEDDVLMGISVWSPRLSNAWLMVLQRLGSQQNKGDISFYDFWLEIVDDGLFNPASSHERKLNGYLVLEIALKEVKSSSLSGCFSKNIMACTIQALRNSDDAYLRKVIEATFENIRTYFEESRQKDVDQLIEGLLVGSALSDFDTFTKTKFVQSFFDITTQLDAEHGVMSSILKWLRDPQKAVKTGINVSTARKNLLAVTQRAIVADTRALGVSTTGSRKSLQEQLRAVTNIILSLLEIESNNQSSNTSSSSRETMSTVYDSDALHVLQSHISSVLESVIATGVIGTLAFMDIVQSLEKKRLKVAPEIAETVNVSWKHFSKFHSMARDQYKKSEKEDAVDKLTTNFGFSLVLALVLYGVHQSDTDSVEMLEEINAMAEDLLLGEISKVANSLADLLMSLVAKPSKLNRRVGSIVFEAFTDNITSDGLSALIEVVTTDETREGQQTLFEQDTLNGEDGADTSNDEDDNGSSSDSDLEDLDSDVEVLDVSDKDSISSSTSSTTEGSQTSSEEGDEEDEQLTSFEKALASALGTRKLNETDIGDVNDESSSNDLSEDSDSDMSDSQMMALDTKLAEVFRNQQNQVSAQKQRKEDARNAKENVVNLKNRALDLIEIFLRSQQQSRGLECTSLLGAVLEMARSTATPQLATRGLAIVKTYVQKTKSGSKLPTVENVADTRSELKRHLSDLYEAVYMKDVTNAFVEVASQVHILLCKLLTRVGTRNISTIAEELSGRHTGRSGMRRKAVQDFWVRFEAWLSTFDHEQAFVGAAEITPAKSGPLKRKSM